MGIIHSLPNHVVLPASVMSLLIHSLSNLEIEKKVKRNWLELPPDVMSLIFMKLGHVHILVSAQWVCTSWWKLCKQPHLFRSIHVEKPQDFGRFWMYSNIEFLERFAREAIDRSYGQLVEFSVRGIATDGLLRYMSEKSRSLRCLRLVSCNRVTDDGLTQVCKRFPQLEELELCNCSFSEAVFGTVGCLCPHLKSFRLNYFWLTFEESDKSAIFIAEKMQELRHLNLFGNRLTDDGLRAILHGCPHLQTLDLRRCFNLKFEGDLKEISANIKIRLPDDSFYDFEYSISDESSSSDSGEDEPCRSDDLYYRSD